MRGCQGRKRQDDVGGNPVAEAMGVGQRVRTTCMCGDSRQRPFLCGFGGDVTRHPAQVHLVHTSGASTCAWARREGENGGSDRIRDQTDQKATRTTQGKPPRRQVTCRETGATWEDAGRRWVLDHRLVSYKWRNVVVDMYSDAMSGLPSEHAPVVLKLNRHVSQEWTSADGYVGLAKCITTAAQRALPTRAGSTKTMVTIVTWQLILRRQREGGDMEPAARNKLRKAIKRSARKDKRACMLMGTGADSSDKDRWKAVRNLKREYAPSHWARTDEQGAPVPKRQKAAEAAKYLAKQHWGDSDEEAEAFPGVDGAWVQGAHDSRYDTAGISAEEKDRALTRMAKNTSPGPDMIPAEVLQALDVENRERLRSTLNDWYRTTLMPAEAKQAQVVTLFKKRNSKLFQNCSRISLLNSLYKLYAAILRARVMHAAEEIVHTTQFGFRPNRSTSQL